MTSRADLTPVPAALTGADQECLARFLCEAALCAKENAYGHAIERLCGAGRFSSDEFSRLMALSEAYVRKACANPGERHGLLGSSLLRLQGIEQAWRCWLLATAHP